MQLLINGQSKQFAQERMTVSDLVDQLQATGKRIAIERNGLIVPRNQFAAVLLTDGDRLEIVGAVGGG